MYVQKITIGKQERNIAFICKYLGDFLCYDNRICKHEDRKNFLLALSGSYLALMYFTKP